MASAVFDPTQPFEAVDSPDVGVPEFDPSQPFEPLEIPESSAPPFFQPGPPSPDNWSPEALRNFRMGVLPETAAQEEAIKKDRAGSAASSFMQGGGVGAGQTVSGLARLGDLLAAGQLSQSALRIGASHPEVAKELLTVARRLDARTPEERERELAENPVTKFGQELAAGAKEAFPENPKFAGEFFTSTIPSSAGQMVPTIAAGMVNPVLASGQYGLSAGQAGAEESIAAGDLKDADKVFLAYLGLGAISEFALGVPANVLRYLRAARAGGVDRAVARETVLGLMLKGGAREAGQETLEQIGQNVVAQQTFDPSRKTMAGVPESAAAGALLGGGVSGMAAATGAAGDALTARLKRQNEIQTETSNVPPPPAEREVEAASQIPPFFRQPLGTGTPPQTAPSSEAQPVQSAVAPLPRILIKALQESAQDYQGRVDHFRQTGEVLPPIEPTPDVAPATPSAEPRTPTAAVLPLEPPVGEAPPPPVNPDPPKGDRIVKIQRADGSTYPAAFGGKFYEHPTRGEVPSIARVVEGKWSHGMLAPGEKIVEPVRAENAQAERLNFLKTQERRESLTKAESRELGELEAQEAAKKAVERKGYDEQRAKKLAAEAAQEERDVTLAAMEANPDLSLKAETVSKSPEQVAALDAAIEKTRKEMDAVWERKERLPKGKERDSLSDAYDSALTQMTWNKRLRDMVRVHQETSRAALPEPSPAALKPAVPPPKKPTEAPTVAPVEEKKPTPSKDSTEFDRLVIENGPDLGWNGDWDTLHAGQPEGGSTMAIEGKKRYSKALQALRRYAANEIGADVSRMDSIQGRAAALPVLRKFLEGGMEAGVQTEIPDDASTDFLPPEPTAAKPALELAAPESVEEQNARLEREESERKAKSDKEKLAQKAAAPLTGTAGDLGQGDLLNAPEDLFAPPAPAQSTAVKPFGSENKIVSTERADLLRQRIKDKLKRTNIGVDPTIFSDAVQLGAYYIEGGYHKFTDWSVKMLEDFGDAIKDHLKSIYETAKITIESPGGASVAGRPAGLQPGLRPPAERIVTARAEFTKPADERILPGELVQFLDAHQRQGAATALKSMTDRGAFLLADGTGAGKTRQAITVAHHYAKQGRKVVIVTKSETIKQDWKKKTFGGSYAFDSNAMGVKIKLARDGVVQPGEIGITTYQNLASVDRASDKNTVIIYDESHALKNDSQQAKFGNRAAAKADKVMFMSATPADKPEHIYYLAPIGVMEGKTIQQALRDLGMTLVTVNKMVKEGNQWVKRQVTFWAEDQNVTDSERHERFSSLFDRMTASGAALKREISMDGVHVQVLRLVLPPEAHETMGSILSFFDANTIDDLQGLKKATVLGHQRRQQEPFKIAPTVMLAKRELDAGRQVVIFVSRVNESEVGKWVTQVGPGGERDRFRTVLMSSEGTVKTLFDALHEAGIHDIAEIHGNADQNSLEAMADFQAGRKRVVIATIESGGTGINLDDTAGNRPRSMIVVTAPFDAVGNVQAAGRIWRLKTLSGSSVYYLFGDTDVDQWNADIIGTKMSMLGAVVEGQVRRLNMSDPELVGTDDFHSTVRREPKSEQPATAPTEVPTLDWKPFKTKAGKDRFVAPATKEFWDWYNANGKGENPLGLRPSKFQEKWQVWADAIPQATESEAVAESQPLVDQAIAKIEDLQKKLRGSGSDVSMGVPKAILDLALEAARLALKAGKTVAQAIDAAIAKLEELNATFNETEVRQSLELELEQEPVAGEDLQHEEEPRAQVAGISQIGQMRPTEHLPEILASVRENVIDARKPLTETLERAWQIARELTDPSPAVRAGHALKYHQTIGAADAGLVTLKQEIMLVGLKQAFAGDDSLLRYTFDNSADFQTTMGGGATSVGRALRGEQGEFYSALYKSLRDIYGDQKLSNAEIASSLDRETFFDLIAGLKDLKLSAEEITTVLETGKTSEGDTLRDVLEREGKPVPQVQVAESAEQMAERILDRYARSQSDTLSWTTKTWNTVREVFNGLLNGDVTHDEFRGTLDSLEVNRAITESLIGVAMRELDIRKQLVVARARERRADAWQREADKLATQGQTTAERALHNLELKNAGAEWLKPENRNRVRDILKKAFSPNEPILQDPRPWIDALRDELEAAGVEFSTATQLAQQVYQARETQWVNANLRAMERAADSTSIRSLVEAVIADPYRAQNSPEWLRKTAVNWFMSNGLTPERAEASYKLFEPQFRKALADAQEKVARQVLESKRKDPRTIKELVTLIRSGVLDPSKNWLDELAERRGWKKPTDEQYGKLEELDEQLSQPDLSPLERRDIVEQQHRIIRHLGKLDGQAARTVAESFLASLLTGIRTFTVQFTSAVAGLRDVAIGAAFNPTNALQLMRAMKNAVVNNFKSQLNYTWQRGISAFHVNEVEQNFSQLERLHEDVMAAFKKGTAAQKAAAAAKYLFAQQRWVLRLLNAMDSASAAVTREYKLAYYSSLAFKEAGLDTRMISELLDAQQQFRQAEYEKWINAGLDHDRAHLRANATVDSTTREFLTNKGVDGRLIDAVFKSAENDSYSVVGRLAPGVQETGKGVSEGLLSKPMNAIVKFVGEQKAKGGWSTIAAQTMFGFVAIPWRSTRFASTFMWYGLMRAGIDAYRTRRGLPTFWKQSYGTVLQSRARLREAIAGTVVGVAAGLLLANTADDDPEDDGFRVYVTGNGPTNKNLRDAWIKRGFQQYAIHFKINGRLVSLPLTRLGEFIMYPFIISASIDDAKWKQKERALTGKPPADPISLYAATLVGSHLSMMGQRGLLQTGGQLYQSMQQTGSFGKGVARLAAGTAAGIAIPFKQLLSSISDMFVGPLDNSSAQAIVANAFPIVGLPFQNKAVNRFGDQMYDRSWYGRIARTGVPIAFQVDRSSDNQKLYPMLVNNGAAPPELRRGNLENKYGPLTDDQFADFAKKSGALLKQSTMSKLSDLQKATPEEAKSFLSKAATQADKTAAAALGLEPLKKPEKAALTEAGASLRAATSSSGSSAASTAADAPSYRTRASTGRLRASLSRRSRTPTMGRVRSRLGRTRLATMRAPRLRRSRLRASLSRPRRGRFSVRSRMARPRRLRMRYV